MNLEEYIRDVPDFPKEGIVFKDITPLLASPEAFGATIGQLADRYRDQGLAKIVGIESRGFIFGAALARALNLPFIPARKPGKLPYETISESYTLEYGETALELHVDAIEKGDKVLVIDDLLATGGTLAAAVALVERLGGEVAEIATIIELTFLNGLEKLSGKPFYSMIQYG